jgi:4-amino-4-deoxy-L-arabinose transferase-like glycosyltransferase
MNGEGGSNPKREIFPLVILVLCLGLFTVKALTSLVQESSTWDETCYFGMGKYLLQHQRWDVPGSILHPPLSFYIHSIPLLFVPTDQEPWKTDPRRVKDLEYLGNSDVLRGQALLSSSQNQNDRLLALSRFMMVLTAVLLGWFVYLWTYALYGKWSAILAVLLFSFSPDVLAHARLITPDITLTTFSFITLYYLWRLLRHKHLLDSILGGTCLGLALLSKFTSVLLFPICFVLILLWQLRVKDLKLPHICLFATIGIGVLVLGYGGHIGAYFDGMSYQREHDANAAYRRFLMGRYSTSGWWYYFLVAFAIKTPIPTIIFIGVAAALLVGKLAKGDWVNEAFLLVPAVVILCFFSLSKHEIGIRYLLPVYPFLFVWAGKAAQWFLSNNFLKALYFGMIAWYIGASCFIHPHYLAYFNELVGGPNNGYKCLVDSNLGWGQDLKGLKSFMQKQGIARISLSYFGSDSPERYGIDYDWLPSFVLHDSNLGQHSVRPKGWVAISATNLQGVYFEDVNIFDCLKRRQPVAKIGYSILIYKIDD